MQRLIAFVITVFLPCYLYAQPRSYSTDEIERLASLGKLWGMLHYFHPNVLSGSVVTDSLIVPAAQQLADNPSADNCRKVVAAMLARTNDAATRLVPTEPAKVHLFTSAQHAALHKLPGNVHYIALPTDIESEEELVKTGLMDDSWRKASAVIIDLRKASYEGSTWSDQIFLGDFFPVLRDALLGNKRIAALQERTAGHNGFVSQTKTTPNVYSSGWRNGVLSAAVKGKENGYGKPAILVLHENTYPDLIYQCLLLSAAGVCKVVIDGDKPFVAMGNTTAISLSDGLSCTIRTSDVFMGNGLRLPTPYASLPIKDTSLSGSFISSCLQWLQTSENKPQKEVTIGNEYVYPTPGRYASGFYPNAGLRLLGLFNWWNAIHYFFPYKHLTNAPWDSVLYEHIPMMLQAKDSIEYLFAVRSMVSRINDSHGFLYNSNPVTPIRKILGYWPPVDFRFVEGKLWITDIGTDTAQDMGQLQLWDEVLDIDDVPVPIAAEKWRNYIASSNESTYYRDVVQYMVNGPKDSKANLRIRRNGKEISVIVSRTGRSTLKSNAVNFNTRYSTLQTMQDSVLYINMGSLSGNQADSLAKVLHQQKVLLFDIRNYPQGTAWTLAPHLTTMRKKAVLFDKPLVTPGHLFVSEGKENLSSYFTVIPADTKKAFKGRVFILCNEQTQSQAEYTIMMFQGATQCTVVGSQTAGADGNVTQVAIPGGYEAWFSGLGILYPDGTQTQRTGIRVDVTVKPTMQGLKAGKDEVLETALQLIGGR